MGKMFLTQPEVFLSTLGEREGGQTDSVAEIEAAIKRMEARREWADAAEAKSYVGYARGLASEEAYSRVRAELRSARSRVITAETVKMLLPQLLKRIQARRTGRQRNRAGASGGRRRLWAPWEFSYPWQYVN